MRAASFRPLEQVSTGPWKLAPFSKNQACVGFLGHCAKHDIVCPTGVSQPIASREIVPGGAGPNPDWAGLGRPHIVLVVADTPRADHAGPWGGGFDRGFEVYRTLFPPGNHAAARATARHHCSTGGEKRPAARLTD